MARFEELQKVVIDGQYKKVKGVVRLLLDGGNSASDIILEGVMGAMSIIANKYKSEEMFIPEVLASASAMAEGMEMLKPMIIAEKRSSLYTGKFVIGTVQGDVHNIGKNIVAMLLESAGFEVIDLGVDVPASEFVTAVKEERPNILGLSALLTTTMRRMKDVIEALTEADIRDRVQVMVGGAPVTKGFADEIGADAYASDGLSAVDTARGLVGKGKS